MKYLKKYENQHLKKINEFKKYIVYVNRYSEDILTASILEILDVKEEINDLKLLFVYNFVKNIEIDISIENNLFDSIGTLKKRIEYSSDNYQNCLDYIENLKIMKKYNL